MYAFTYFGSISIALFESESASSNFESSIAEIALLA